MADLQTRSWKSAGAWDTVAPPNGRLGAKGGVAGVVLEPLDHVALSTIIVRSGQQAAFAAFAADRWHFTPPVPGEAAFGEKGDLVWSGPDQWLAVSRDGADLDDLPRALKEVAAVTDQGDGRALVAISGPAARRMLAKVLAIDMHPGVFVPCRVALTVVAHVSAQIWLRPDAKHFILAVPRTSAGSTWAALTAAGAEYGCDIRSVARLAPEDVRVRSA